MSNKDVKKVPAPLEELSEEDRVIEHELDMLENVISKDLR